VDANRLNIPLYWIRSVQALPAQAGMHRFLWNLRYPAPESLERQYPISAIYHDTPRYPLGPAVLPGRYTVKLTVDGKTYIQPLTVKMDPRVTSSKEDLRREFELEMNITEAMHRDYRALQQVRSMRHQLQAAKGRAPAGPIPEAIAGLDKKLDELEGQQEGATFLSTPKGRSLARLNGGLTTLLETVGSADAAPTEAQLTTFADVKNALDQQLAGWEKIRKEDIPALNLKFKQAGLQLLNSESAAIIGQEWHSTEKAAGED
jgi:hypothetical protein